MIPVSVLPSSPVLLPAPPDGLEGSPVFSPVPSEGLEGFPVLPPPLLGPFFTASMSITFSPFFSAFKAAVCSDRLATGLKAARPMRFSKSVPGVKMMFTAVMFFDVNVSQLSAPSLLMDNQKLPVSSHFRPYFMIR